MKFNRQCFGSPAAGNHSRGRFLGWILLLLFLSLAQVGCNSVERRIQRNPELFAGLEPEEQEAIRQGRVEIGFTPEMVSLAWGRPDQRQVIRTSDEEDRQIWSYVSRRSIYNGRRFAGYRSEVYYDRRSKQYRSVPRPVYVNTYRTVENEVARVEFKSGKAAVVTLAE